MNPRIEWLAAAAAAGANVAAAFQSGRRRVMTRRRRRTRWLLFWAVAAMLAPAGRWLNSLRPAVVGRR